MRRREEEEEEEEEGLFKADTARRSVFVFRAHLLGTKRAAS